AERFCASELLNGRKDAVDAHASRQGTGVRSLNNRTVGNGIAVGKTDLDQVGPVLRQGLGQRGYTIELGISCRQERDERLSPLGAKTLEQRIDRVHRE